MRRFLTRVLSKAIRLLAINEEYTDEQKMNLNTLKEQQVTSNSIQAKRVVQWFKDDGDKTHRINYDLNKDAVVIDLGGYEGHWAADIFCKYDCYIHIFEPVQEFAQNIKERFEKNKKVRVYTYGLSNTNKNEKFTQSG